MDSEIKTMLEKSVRKAVGSHFRKASPFCTRQTISLRVIKDICDILDVPISVIQDTKNLLSIPLDISRTLEEVWNQQLASQQVAGGVSVDESSLMEKFLAKDYARPSELMKLANVLDKKMTLPECRHQLNLIFAVDGFSGYQFKDYVENLKFGSEGNCSFTCAHVQAVRELYHATNNSHEVFRVLQKIFGIEIYGDEGEHFLKLENIYIDAVGSHLEKIAEWKSRNSGRSDGEMKKMGGRKRKHKEGGKKVKKVVVEEAPIAIAEAIYNKDSSESESEEEAKESDNNS